MLAPGKVLNLYDMQVNYGGFEGVDLGIYAMKYLLRAESRDAVPLARRADERPRRRHHRDPARACSISTASRPAARTSRTGPSR